jgi:hypothetical protein
VSGRRDGQEPEVDDVLMDETGSAPLSPDTKVRFESAHTAEPEVPPAARRGGLDRAAGGRNEEPATTATRPSGGSSSGAPAC